MPDSYNHYHDEEGYFTHSALANPGTLPPDNALRVDPGREDGMWPQRQGNGWVQVPDLRKTKYWTADQQQHEITELGETVPPEATLTAPPDQWYKLVDGEWQLDTAARAEWLSNSLRSTRDQRLRDCDIRVLPDYPQTDDERAAWLAYRAALRDLPQQDGFPWNGPDDPIVPWPIEPEA